MRVAAAVLLALVAGCIQFVPEHSPGGPTPAMPIEQGPTPAPHPLTGVGLLATGSLQSIDPFTAVMYVNNTGPETYTLRLGGPWSWSDSMRNATAEVAHRPPSAAGQAYTATSFAPGEYLAQMFHWDGTVMDAANQTLVPAPSGTYVWTITFRAWPEGDEGEPTERFASFEFVIP